MLELIAGALIGAVISWYFATESSKELAHASARLIHESHVTRELINSVARSLDAEGVIVATWDEHGNLTSFKRIRVGSAEHSAEAFAPAVARDSAPKATPAGTAVIRRILPARNEPG